MIPLTKKNMMIAGAAISIIVLIIIVVVYFIVFRDPPDKPILISEKGIPLSEKGIPLSPLSEDAMFWKYVIEYVNAQTDAMVTKQLLNVATDFNDTDKISKYKKINTQDETKYKKVDKKARNMLNNYSTKKGLELSFGPS